MSPIDPDDFDLDGLDAAADAYATVLRASQRREARKLQPLIERLIARQPAMLTSDVLKTLRAEYRGGALPTTATFVREIGSICKEVRQHRGKGKGVVRNAKPDAHYRNSNANIRPALGPTTVPVAAVVPSSATNLDIQPTTAEPAHPLKIHAGKFGGKVYVHGKPIQAFFSAVEKRLDDRTLNALAQQVQADATSRVRLIDLHVKDRAIFDAALALA